MTNQELRTLATVGVRERIATMQAELAVYHEEWPELFLTVPHLLKTNGHNGNGHQPAPMPPAATTDAAPVRRRTMSKRARMAMSAAQKARWAKHRAKKRANA